MGLKNPAIDEVLETLMVSEDYEEVGLYARVFDRIMMANWYVIPKFWPRYDFGAYWNTMSHPEKYCSGLWYFYNVLWFWWEDVEKRERLEKRWTPDPSDSCMQRRKPAQRAKAGPLTPDTDYVVLHHKAIVADDSHGDWDHHRLLCLFGAGAGGTAGPGRDDDHGSGPGGRRGRRDVRGR